VLLDLRTFWKHPTATTCGIALLCAWAFASYAQRFSFRSAGEGLGDLNVNCIAQDRTGYLWIGTENGLYRYDGAQFKRYGAAQGVRARTIQNLFVGPDGTLWVGTTTDLYFGRGDGNFTEVPPPAPINEFSQRIGSAFAALGQDRIAMADRSGAFELRRIGAGQWIAEPMHLEGTRILSVLSGPNGELWYGCDKDLCRVSGGKITHLRASAGLPEDDWLHLLRTRDGHIWIRGIAHIGELNPDGTHYQAHELPGALDPVPYSALIEDAQGRVAATQGADFGLWQGDHWRMVTARNGLSSHNLSALFVDREGSLWMGIVGHGLMRWLGQGRWESYTVAEGLSNDIVWASLRDETGRLWICTESGIDSVAAGSDAPAAWKQNGIETARAMSIVEQDGVWVGTAAGSLIRIDERSLKGTQWKIPEVYRIAVDAGHRLWIATAGGLYALDPREVSRGPQPVLDAAFANPRQRFTDLTVDGSDNLWAASDNGFYRLNASGWKHIDPGLAGVKPFLLAADHAGNLWVTGSFAGAMRLRVVGDHVEEAAHAGRPPLLSEQVASVLVDHRGWLWVGQDAGLSVFNGRAWRNFTEDDGLAWNDIDANGLMEDKDGSLWVSTSEGISHFIAPESAAAEPPAAPVLSDVRFGSATLADGTQVPWNESPLEISLSLLNFGENRHVRIRYRLFGLDPDWVDTTEKNIRYARLAPGSYRFEAQAVDAGSGAASAVRSLSFRIQPRWWQSELLPLGFSLLAGIAVVLLVRLRVQRLQGQKKQLELAVQLRTEDLEREKVELLSARDQLRHHAEHDGLTGLWNHRIIIDRLRNEIDRSQREGTPIGVILADIDHFKVINDTHGHRAGDLVLKEIGDIFVALVRSYDWVGRYGGEEFLLILPGSGFVAARSRAEQLRLAVEAMQVKYGTDAIPVTASFGVASGFPKHHEVIIQAADTALYRAKNNGRNCVMGAEIQTESAK
jgi:diguanylate cyclase (GGDEF)-like protein